MQLFVPYSDPIESLLALDRRRLLNQINECHIIVRAINGSRAWRKHPIVLMYKAYPQWVEWYADAAKELSGDTTDQVISHLRNIEPARPPFIGFEPLHASHRSRLFTKDPAYYSRFKADGTSNLNLYIVDSEILYYRDGKKVASRQFPASQSLRQTSH